MIIARISRYATKERVLANSWLLKLFMVLMEILFLTYFWKKAHIWSKRPFLTSQNDGLLSMDTLLNQNIKYIYCEYHVIIYPLPQTSPNFFQNALNTNSKSFHERKMTNFTEKMKCMWKNTKCHFLSCFWKKTIFIFQVVNFDHVYLSGKFWG